MTNLRQVLARKQQMICNLMISQEKGLKQLYTFNHHAIHMDCWVTLQASNKFPKKLLYR